jgi:hypothetical protein
MNLAMLECEVGLAPLYRRLPDLRPLPGATLTQAPGPVARSWLGLPMRYDRDALADADPAP